MDEEPISLYKYTGKVVFYFSVVLFPCQLVYPQWFIGGDILCVIMLIVRCSDSLYSSVLLSIRYKSTFSYPNFVLLISHYSTIYDIIIPIRRKCFALTDISHIIWWCPMWIVDVVESGWLPIKKNTKKNYYR